MTKEKVALLGASNAGGWSFGNRGTDYNVPNILEASFGRHRFVTNTPEKLIIDLRNNPKLADAKRVVDATFPGDSTRDMEEKFVGEVLPQNPTHIFFWSGLNDIVVAATLLNSPGQKEHDDEYQSLIDALRNAITDPTNKDLALQKAAQVIVDPLSEMASTAKAQGILPLVGTVPPFSSVLTNHVQEGNREAQYFFGDGLRLVGMVNNHLRELAQDDCRVDAFNLVVDPDTGLSKAEYSYGETVPRFGGDILHLNSFGLIRVAAVVCEKVHQKAVEIKLPDSARLRNDWIRER
jgi:hypothetical protein